MPKLGEQEGDPGHGSEAKCKPEEGADSFLVRFCPPWLRAG